MKKLLAIFGLIVLLSGCSAKYVPPDYSMFVWPPRPQKTRIRLLKILRSDVDVRSSSTSEQLFGKVASVSFAKPHDVAVDAEGNIFVSDPYRKKVFVFNYEKNTVDNLHNPLGWDAPSAIAVDDRNGLLAVTTDKHVHLFDLRTRAHKTAIGNTERFERPGGVAFDPEREILYIADTQNHEVYAYDYGGNRIDTIATIGGDEGKVYFPTGLDTDSEGNLYVVDTMNFSVQIFKPDGSFLRRIGVHGDTPGAFGRPRSVSVSKDGFIFVADASFHNYQIFDKEGNLYMFIGFYGTAPALFKTPAGIFVDQDDKIYVVDQSNRRVQIFQLYTDSYYEEHPEEAAKFDSIEKRKKAREAATKKAREAAAKKAKEEAEAKAAAEEAGAGEEFTPTPTQEEIEDIGW
jgi:DNA-binding beta-propeller fold protein YncE